MVQRTWTEGWWLRGSHSKISNRTMARRRLGHCTSVSQRLLDQTDPGNQTSLNAFYSCLVSERREWDWTNSLNSFITQLSIRTAVMPQWKFSSKTSMMTKMSQIIMRWSLVPSLKSLAQSTVRVSRLIESMVTKSPSKRFANSSLQRVSTLSTIVSSSCKVK